MPSDPRYVRPSTSADWDPYKDIIMDLYKSKKLKEVMEMMETVYWFKATPRQYKSKIKEWDIDKKYTKTEEYIGILKVKRRRERENPNRQTLFYLRGKPIDDSAIQRFENRAIKRGLITAEETLSDRDSVSSLECLTPTESYAEGSSSGYTQQSYQESYQQQSYQ